MANADNSPQYWLFSAPVDLAVFLGSALAALALLVVGAETGWLYATTPEWAWVPAILLVDVAHVYATGFRVYLDPVEWQRRRLLYSLVPVIGFLAGVVLYSQGEMIFWRTLAYFAVFHFIRQQYGWVSLYRSRRGEHGWPGRLIDTTAIYLATIYPLIHWHAHLPRQFWWFLENDFANIPPVVEEIVQPIYWMALAAYAASSLYRGLFKHEWNPGKDIVLATTAICWHVGIITFNSDYAFTVTNVLIHGIPYLALVYWYRWERQPDRGQARRNPWQTLLWFLATVWILAYIEEMFWHRGVWHERSWLFGESWQLASYQIILIPLLALPQLTHYVLDGFIWRRKSNPRFTLVPLTNDNSATPLSQSRS